MNNPIISNHGHQCICDVFHAIIAGPIAGIHATVGEGYLAFLAIAMNAKLV